MTEMVAISGAGLFLMWTSTIVGFAWWMNNRFNRLLPIEDYFRKHDILEERLRRVEISMAKMCQKLNGFKDPP